MKIRCLKCEEWKTLTTEELKEVGEFVKGRKLRAVHFLKYLSMDLRNPCSNGKEHVYEFEESFDKEIHKLAMDIKNSRIKNTGNIGELLNKMREIAWIPDETLWS
jgi:superfamily II DNA helicase RecQ